jgi:hypothetical protein
MNHFYGTDFIKALGDSLVGTNVINRNSLFIITDNVVIVLDEDDNIVFCSDNLYEYCSTKK